MSLGRLLIGWLEVQLLPEELAALFRLLRCGKFFAHDRAVEAVSAWTLAVSFFQFGRVFLQVLRCRKWGCDRGIVSHQDSAYKHLEMNLF